MVCFFFFLVFGPRNTTKSKSDEFDNISSAAFNWSQFHIIKRSHIFARICKFRWTQMNINSINIAINTTNWWRILFVYSRFKGVVPLLLQHLTHYLYVYCVWFFAIIARYWFWCLFNILFFLIFSFFFSIPFCVWSMVLLIHSVNGDDDGVCT